MEQLKTKGTKKKPYYQTVVEVKGLEFQKERKASTAQRLQIPRKTTLGLCRKNFRWWWWWSFFFSYVTSRMNSWGSSKLGKKKWHFWCLLLLSLLRLSSSFSNRICIIEQYLLAAADAEEEAERRLKILLYFPSFLSSSFLETLVCQEEWLLSSLWLFFYFPDTSQCLNNVTKVSLLSYTYTSSPDLVKSLKLNNFGFGQLKKKSGYQLIGNLDIRSGCSAWIRILNFRRRKKQIRIRSSGDQGTVEPSSHIKEIYKNIN